MTRSKRVPFFVGATFEGLSGPSLRTSQALEAERARKQKNEDTATLLTLRNMTVEERQNLSPEELAKHVAFIRSRDERYLQRLAREPWDLPQHLRATPEPSEDERKLRKAVRASELAVRAARREERVLKRAKTEREVDLAASRMRSAIERAWTVLKVERDLRTIVERALKLAPPSRAGVFFL